MTETTNSSRSPEEIQADIEQQREQLADTVDLLTRKLDVKAQGKAKVEDLKDRATNDDGNPRPELIGVAAGSLVVIGLLIWWRRRA
jgi:hypothetical protein